MYNNIEGEHNKARTDVLHVRVDPSVKHDAEQILSQLGLSTADAINVFLKQVVLKGGLPFDVVLPKYNEITGKAMEEAVRISTDGKKGFTNTSDLFEELNS